MCCLCCIQSDDALEKERPVNRDGDSCYSTAEEATTDQVSDVDTSNLIHSGLLKQWAKDLVENALRSGKTTSPEQQKQTTKRLRKEDTDVNLVKKRSTSTM